MAASNGAESPPRVPDRSSARRWRYANSITGAKSKERKGGFKSSGLMTDCDFDPLLEAGLDRGFGPISGLSRGWPADPDDRLRHCPGDRRPARNREGGGSDPRSRRTRVRRSHAARRRELAAIRSQRHGEAGNVPDLSPAPLRRGKFAPARGAATMQPWRCAARARERLRPLYPTCRGGVIPDPIRNFASPLTRRDRAPANIGSRIDAAGEPFEIPRLSSPGRIPVPVRRAGSELPAKHRRACGANRSRGTGAELRAEAPLVMGRGWPHEKES